MRPVGNPRGRHYAALILVLLPLSAALAPSAAAQSKPLSGTIVLTPGACSGDPTGSYFRMIVPTGGQSGPYVENRDSTCGNRTYTILSPGTESGLTLGRYQAEPSPAFDSAGNSLANRIIQPARFFGTNFSASTNKVDPQTSQNVPVPALTVTADGKLGGDLRAFAASWNRQEFNQGSPKPDGSKPGLTSEVGGTYDSGSGAIVVEWKSQIVGGPFDRFTGVWRLEGRLVAAESVPQQTDQPAKPDATTAPGSTVRPSGATTAPGATLEPGTTPDPSNPEPDDGVASDISGASKITTTAAKPVTEKGSGNGPLAAIGVAAAAIAAAGAIFFYRRRAA